MQVRLITDQALGEAQVRSSDGLGFSAYSRVLSQVALDTPGPFTIGVFGEWGSGKTSLMRMIQKELLDKPDIVTVWFNAWRYEKEQHPIVPLVGTIVAELEAFESRSHKNHDSSKNLIRALRAVAYAFSAKSTVKIPGFAEVEASFIAKDMIDRKERLALDPLLDRSLYYGAFSALESIRLGEDIRVVVLIDDLDRCFPNQAIHLLESIKLVLAQPGFIFILGVARQVIEGYLQHRYISEYGISDFKGYMYLDKIVQLPFPIPPSAGRMKDFCASILEAQPSEIAEKLSETLVIVAEALGGNPRAVIRFLNNILVDLAISSELPQNSEMEGIPIEYFAITRCLEQRWPKVFDQLAASALFTSDIADWEFSSLTSHLDASNPNASIAASLIADHRLAELLFSNHGKAWLKNEDLRRGSIEFLRTQRRVSSMNANNIIPPDVNVYVIHAARDYPEIAKFIDLLQARGFKISTNSEIGNAATKIGASIACLCLGAESITDPMRTHLDTTQYNRVPVLPVILRDGDPDHIPAYLSNIAWLDLRTPLTETNFERLERVLLDMGRFQAPPSSAFGSSAVDV